MSDTGGRPDEAQRLGALRDAYHAALTSYVDRGGEDHLSLVERMVERGAVYGGRAICPFLRPVFLLRSQYQELARLVRVFRSAVVKAKDAVLESPELLEALALTDGERRLLDVNPAFKSVGVVTRLDTLLTERGPQLVELNAEGAFGGSYADRLSELFDGFQPMREFARKLDDERGARGEQGGLERAVAPVQSGATLVRAILDAWHEFGGNSVPRVAVVDWREVATRAELDLVCERFQRHGIAARFVDPRELEYVDGELRAGGEVIDLVYRRLLTNELLAREDEVRPLVSAYRAGVVCVVNSFRAKLLDKKILFALLHDARIRACLTPEENEVIGAHVPWTRRVADEKTTGPDGGEIDLLSWASQHRTRLVLKPNDDVLGRGVVMGANVEQGVWDRGLKLASIEPSVVQERVAPPSEMFPEVGAAGELFFSRRYVELDAYLFRGELGGLLARLSATTLCNVSAGAGTTPVFVVGE